MDRHLGTKEEERQNEKSRDIQVGPSSEALAVRPWPFDDTEMMQLDHRQKARLASLQLCIALRFSDKQYLDPEGWDWEGRGRGFRMGNTCTPMADSSQCMTKPIQYCKVISLQLK